MYISIFMLILMCGSLLQHVATCCIVLQCVTISCCKSQHILIYAPYHTLIRITSFSCASQQTLTSIMAHVHFFFQKKRTSARLAKISYLRHSFADWLSWSLPFIQIRKVHAYTHKCVCVYVCVRARACVCVCASCGCFLVFGFVRYTDIHTTVCACVVVCV